MWPSWATRTAHHWRALLARYAFPALGSLPVAAVDDALVMKCIEPVWQAKPLTGNILRARIESVLDYAAARVRWLHPL